MWLMAFISSLVIGGCGGGNNAVATPIVPIVPIDTTVPAVLSTSPSHLATNIPVSVRNSLNVVDVYSPTATFNIAMDPASILSPLLTFSLKETVGNINVPGTVSLDATHKTATFKPTVASLTPGINYTATVSTAAKSPSGIAMLAPVVWSFTTASNVVQGLLPVNLGTAGNFVILAKATITDVPASLLTGNIGVSPGAGTTVLVSCAEMTGFIYTVDANYVGNGNTTCVKAGPGANKTIVDNAILDMGVAYLDAAGRTLPTATELAGGAIGGLTITPGLYKWSTAVTINTNVTLDALGNPNAVWIFQIAGDLSVASAGSVPAGVKVILAGGAKASNVFWQVGGGTGANLGTYSTFNGIILSGTQGVLQTGAVLNGRVFANTQVTLQMNTITQPAP
jgi:hypothetical protein